MLIALFGSFQPHTRPPWHARSRAPAPPQVRGLSFAPTDLKFCSCSDDTTIKARCAAPSARAGWTR